MPTAWDQSCGTTAPAPRRGGPAGAVVEASEGADLLVLGRHKQRTDLGPRLGPVTQASVHHARCPVVVPHDRAEPAGGAGGGGATLQGSGSVPPAGLHRFRVRRVHETHTAVVLFIGCFTASKAPQPMAGPLLARSTTRGS
ncbi:universal stress protein [Streptomyces europaeiscabiei]|uniref:universal stress protein n=1 Tax=Streptomyces europaeiscabiei TaxID=146819 RepID=UPI0038F67B09